MLAVLGTLHLPHGLCGSTGSTELLAPLALHHSGVGTHWTCQMLRSDPWRTLRKSWHKSCCSQQPPASAPERPARRSTLGQREPEPSKPHQSSHGHCCLFTPVSRDRAWKNHPGATRSRLGHGQSC